MTRRRALLLYKQQAPIGIGETRAEQADRLTAVERQVKRGVRAEIWRTRFSCQLCHGRRVAACAGLPDEMHEEPSRAMTRGLPPEQRFNLQVCGRVCAACHRDLTRHTLRVIFHTDRGFQGPVTATTD